MEAVPRLPMLHWEVKDSQVTTDFEYALKKYIRDNYREDPESYSKEVKEIETLRVNAMKAPLDYTGCSILKRYYCQLHKLQSRFPMTDDGAACVPFTWIDIYSGVSYNITDVEYEQACILYNIGAMHSKVGAMDSRSDAEGMKVACTHYQCGAWAFQHLREKYPQPKGSDMSHDLLTFFINIMLAQAQECILEKSMLDSRKSSITAKIAAQVVDYQKCALGILVAGSPSTDTGSILDIVGSKLYKTWKKFVEFKIAYYTSVSHLYMGCQAEENEKWGERVAWFQSANDFLLEAMKINKSRDEKEDSLEPLTFTMDVVGGKLNSSKKENEFVYHEKVPALTSLPELKGASLVKGIPFNTNDTDVSGPDIFSRLVPMEAHETSSLYSEEKAKLLRSVVARIESRNEELLSYLSSLQLEEVPDFQEEVKIPQDLLEKCAAMSVRPNAIKDLTELLNELMRLSKDVDSGLKLSMSLLQDEEKKELQHQENFGKRGPSMIIVELKTECSKYEEAHKKAAESNNTLETAVNIYINNMTKLLMPLEELAEQLPSVISVKTPENEKVMDEYEHILKKVFEMKSQREYLEQQLREALMKDDITKDLVTLKKKNDLQKVFEEELKKHSECLTYLEQNLSAQDNILCALTEANANSANVRKSIKELRYQRDMMVKTLVESFESYPDLINKAKKGIDFYEKLESNVSRLCTRARSVSKVQDEERTQIAGADRNKNARFSMKNADIAESNAPKLKDFLPYMSKQGGVPIVPAGMLNTYPRHLPTANISPLPSENFPPPTNGDRNVSYTGQPSFPSDLGTDASLVIRPNTAQTTDSSAPRAPQFPGSVPYNYPISQTTLNNSISAASALSQNFGTYSNAPRGPNPSNINHIQNNIRRPETGLEIFQPIYPTSSTGQTYSYTRVNAYSNAVPSGAYPHGNQPTTYPGSMPSNHPSSQNPLPQSQPYNNAAVPSNSNQGRTLNSNPDISYHRTVPQTSFSIQSATYATGYNLQNQPIATATPNISQFGQPANPYHPPNQYGSNIESTVTSQTDPRTSMLYSTSQPSAFSPSQPQSNSVVPPPGSNATAYLGKDGGVVNQQNYYNPYEMPKFSNAPAPTPSPNSPYLPSNPAYLQNGYSSAGTPNNYSNYVGTGASQVPQGAIYVPPTTRATVPQTSYSGTINPNSHIAPTAASGTVPSSSYNSISNPYTSINATGNLPTSIYSGSACHPPNPSSTTVPSMSYPATSYPGTIPQSSWPSSVPSTAFVGSVPFSLQQGTTVYSAVVPPIQHQGSVATAKNFVGNVPQNLQQVSMTSSETILHSTQHKPVPVMSYPGVVPPNSQQIPPTSSGTVLPYSQQASFSAIPYSGSVPGNSHQIPSTTVTALPSSHPGTVPTMSYPNAQQGAIPPMPYQGMIPTNSHQRSTTLNSCPESNSIPQMNVPSDLAGITNSYSSPSKASSSYSGPYNHTPQTIMALQPLNNGYGNFQNPVTQCNNSTPQFPLNTPQASLSNQEITCPPLQPITSNSRVTTPNLEERRGSTDSQSSAIRDLITPPLENEAAKPENSEEDITMSVLQPQVIDLNTLIKEKDAMNPAKDPLDDPSVRSKFINEVEKYEKLVEGLVRKSLNGTTPLDQKWKELCDTQDKESRKLSISVARCCPLKNRFPDVMPYDSNRVTLTSAKDDYINASYLKDICSNSPVYVITQAPLPATFTDFWLMVWEQQVETLICLLSDVELKSHIYFPKEKGQVVPAGSFEISLQSSKEKNGFIERMINVTHTKNRTSRVVVHLQFLEWPGSGVPQSPAIFLQFVSDVLSYQKQQRNLLRPVVVHCSSGIGRSGCFCLITSLVNEMNGGHGPRDVGHVSTLVSQQRKFLIQDKEQLKFCYDAVLYYAQDLLMKRGILTTRASFEDKLPSSGTTSSHVRHPSEDFILGSGGLAKLQSGMEKMGLAPTNPEPPCLTNQQEPPPLEGSGDKNPEEEIKPESENKTESNASVPPSITSILDPLNFTLDGCNSPAKRKITKDNFERSKGSLTTSSVDEADPLSQLDPLWSLKK